MEFMWNYRLIRDNKGILHIHEVFYTKKWRIWGYSEPIKLSGMKKKDIVWELKYMLIDVAKYKILDESWIKAHLAKPKWLNPSKKELLKTISLEKLEKKKRKKK